MKKFLFINFFVFTLLFFYSFTLVLAQEFDSRRAYEDYLYAYNQYRQAHQEYIAARQAYLNYKTLTSKTEALNKTLRMLQLRDDVVRTHLTSLRLRLAQVTGISNYELNVLYLKLDAEVNWYLKHRDILSSAGSLEDLISSSDEAQNQYQETEGSLYQTLGAILAGKENTLRERINQEIGLIKSKISEIRQKGDKDTSTAERWILEAENRLTRSQEKHFTAAQILTKIKSYGKDRARAFNDSQFALEESNQYLKEANSYLQEVIREVKRGR